MATECPWQPPKVQSISDTARRALVFSTIFVGVVALALAVWQLKAFIALVFLSLTIAAAMRPTVEWLARYRIPRTVGILLHYALFALLVAVFLWLLVPRLLEQVNDALGIEGLPTSGQDLDKEVDAATGVREEVLSRIRDWLSDLPAGDNLREQILDPAIELTRTIVELVIAVFFTFAIAAYWIFERDRTINGLLRFLRPESRQRAYNTWMLIDAKLGAFVRGQLILIVFVATVLSTFFRAIDLPYWLLIGLFAGLVEIIPIIGPNVAGLLAVGAGFTDSWQKGVLAGLIVFGVRMFQDYVVSPRVLGRAVGMSPLFVLLAVGVVGLLFGGFYVILALPLLAVLATVFDVIVLEKDPTKEPAPKVIFPSKDVEGSAGRGLDV